MCKMVVSQYIRNHDYEAQDFVLYPINSVDRFMVEKLILIQLLKIFPTSYGIWKFITISVPSLYAQVYTLSYIYKIHDYKY
jgi:hypothetical protein